MKNDIAEVTIEPELMEALTPNEYLSSLGIDREQREEKIKQLAYAVLKPDIPDNFQAQIPFMVTKGPLIKEVFLTVNVKYKDANGKPVIILSLAKEPNEPEVSGISG